MSDEDLRGRFRRDYTKELIGQTRPPKKAPVAHTPKNHLDNIAAITSDDLNSRPRKVKKHKNRFKLLKLFLILTLIGILCTAGYYYYAQAQVVPKNIQDQAEIPILYPTKLPEGYSIAKNSFSVTNGNIISYYAESQGSNRLLFTVQTRPSNFDFEQFYAKSLTNRTKFSTPLGEAAAGTAGDRLLGSLATERSWILITTNNPSITIENIVIALRSLKQIN